MDIFRKPYWIIGIVISVLIWYAASTFNWLDKSLLASPKEALDVITSGSAFDKRSIWAHTRATLENTLSGWGITVLLGSFVGYYFGVNKILSDSIKGVFEFFRAIPPILIFPLMLVIYENSQISYIYTVIFGCFPIMFLTIIKGVNNISKGSLEILKTTKVSRKRIVLVRILDSFPSIILGARLSFSFALIIAVVCEMVKTQESNLGLGSLARDSMSSFETPTFYAVLLILGAIGLLGNSLLLILEKNFKLN